MKKRALALAAVSIILLASFVIVPQTSSSPGSQTHRYIVMGGITTASTQFGASPPNIWTVPFARAPYLTPRRMMQNITFSDPWFYPGYGWIVNLTVPHQTYVGLNHAWYDSFIAIWFRWSITMAQDGYGWIFLNATGDVDCYTFNNDTGVYWKSPSPKAGQLAALTGQLPSPGPDGVAGTAVDGFGDGTNDTRGSSILYLPTTLLWEYHDGAIWRPMVSTPFPMVMTTQTVYDIVIEPASLINGVNSTWTGHPWEFLAGWDLPGQQVDYGHPKWNAYVTYACAWSMLNVPTALGNLDIMYQIVEKKVREDCVIADINCDEKVDIIDIVMAGLAFGAEDEGVGPDGIPGTPDDKPVADPNFDARGDVSLWLDNLVDIYDLCRIACDFGKKLTPQCIVGP